MGAIPEAVVESAMKVQEMILRDAQAYYLMKKRVAIVPCFARSTEWLCLSFASNQPRW